MNSKTSTKCNSSISQLQREMKSIDEHTTMSLKLPYNLWRCGWQIDDFGMVLVRKAASITSRHDAKQFNHCCAIHMDCYSSQLGREKCDKEFERCGSVRAVHEQNSGGLFQRTIDSSKGSHQANELFKQILNDLVELTSEGAYRNAVQLKMVEVNFETYGSYQFDGFQLDPVNKAGQLFRFIENS